MAPDRPLEYEGSEMQTQNPFLDEMAKLTTAAMGLAQARRRRGQGRLSLPGRPHRWPTSTWCAARNSTALKAEVAARAELDGVEVASAPKRDASGCDQVRLIARTWCSRTARSR